jgi:hypothetical protein
MDLTMIERVGDRWGKMEGSCSTGQSPQWAVVPVEEEEEESVYKSVDGLFCLFFARRHPLGQGLLVHEVSRSHITTTHHNR